jgi:hypothetical protein
MFRKFEAFLEISILFEDIFREIEAFQQIRGFLKHLKKKCAAF